CRKHAYCLAAFLALDPVLHASADAREKRVIAADAHIAARVHDRAPLPHQDLTGVDELAAEHLYAEPLRLRVAAVTRAAARLLVCHGYSSRMSSMRSSVYDWRWPCVFW